MLDQHSSGAQNLPLQVAADIGLREHSLPKLEEALAELRTRLSGLTPEQVSISQAAHDSGPFQTIREIELPTSKAEFEKTIALLDAEALATQKVIDLFTDKQTREDFRVNPAFASTRAFYQAASRATPQTARVEIVLPTMLAGIADATAVIGLLSGTLWGILPGLVLGFCAASLGNDYGRPFIATALVAPFYGLWDVVRAVTSDLPKLLLHKTAETIASNEEHSIIRQARAEIAAIEKSRLSISEKISLKQERAVVYQAHLAELDQTRCAISSEGERRFQLHTAPNSEREYESIDALRHHLPSLESVVLVSPRSLLQTIVNSPDSHAAAAVVAGFLSKNLDVLISGGTPTIEAEQSLKLAVGGYVASLKRLEAGERQEKLSELVALLSAIGEV